MPPTVGAHVDLAVHTALFPAGSATVTTGAGTTHANAGSILLGPGEVRPHLLAHEFGHILGFHDRYFRGYHDLGRDGFEVVEVVADPDDLMGNPDDGIVPQRYYDLILDAVARRTKEAERSDRRH